MSLEAKDLAQGFSYQFETGPGAIEFVKNSGRTGKLGKLG